MKLVNPVGRDVSTFDTKANSGCRCICCDDLAHFGGQCGSHTGACGCSCYENNDANSNANAQIAIQSSCS